MTLAAAALVALGTWCLIARPTRHSVLRRHPVHRRAADPATVITTVCGHLRAGAPPAEAWSRVGVIADAFGCPHPRSLAGVLTDDVVARAVHAACRVATETGAPLAPALGQVTEALAAEESARDDRESALAGPRTTARVLAWLPALGVVVGFALGADPLRVLLGGGIGTAALVGGAALLLVGHRWTAALVAHARAAGVADTTQRPRR